MKNILFLTLIIFSLTLTAAEGDSCDNPITANMGENSATTVNGKQWFKFTATTAGDYLISNNEYLDEADMVMLRVYSDCNTEIDTLVDMGSSGSIVMVSLAVNDSVMLMWRDDYSQVAFTFKISTVETGEAFAKPIVINEQGTITFPADKEELYYSYTLTDTAVVILSEDDNNGYDYQTYLYKNNGNMVDDGYLDEQKYHLEPGTYIIKMKSYKSESFDWTLTERNLILGEYFYAPIVLTETAEVDFGGNTNRVYYSFTAQADGKICGANMSEANVTIYNESNGIELYNAYDITEFCFDIETGNEYIIYLKATEYGIDEFTWNFIVADGSGESCDNPIVIDAFGTISSPEGSGLLYFSFKANESGAFKISDGIDIAENKVELYANCNDVANGFNYAIEIGYEGEILYEADANEEFIIVWDIGGGGQPTKEIFTWSIIADDTPGLSCDNPIILSETGNVQYTEGYSELYYSYTATRDCRLELTFGDDFSGTLKMYLDCDGEQPDQQCYGNEMVVYAEKDITYIFKWSLYYEPYNSFTWTINEEDYHGGEVCKYPQVISEPGDIEFTQTEWDSEWYYSYTATIDGAIKVSDGNNESLVVIYSDCDEQNGYVYSSIGELTTTGTTGVTYIIRWTNKENEAFTWSLIEEEGVPGETCNNPIIISEVGSLNSPKEFEVTATTGYTYFSFTLDENKMLVVTDDDKYNSVAIDTTCDFNTASYGNSGELSTEILAGTTYIIRWESTNSSGFTWTAYSRDLLPGETPHTAIVIPTPGDIEFLNERAELYYKYTATQNAAIEMNTNAESPYVNNGSLKYVDEGETIIIWWVNPDETAFTWTLVERDIIDGETCSNPIAVTSAGNVVCNVQLKNVYYSYSPTENSIIKVTDGDNSHYVYVTKGCNVSSYYYTSDGEIAFEAATSDNIIIRWNNNSMEEFTWNIVEETPQTGETANNPIVIDEPTTVEYIGTNKGLVRNYYSYTPAVKQQVKLSLVNFAMVWDAATGDTISEVYYDSTTFVANKNSKYIIVWELGSGTIDTLTLTATEIQEETNTVTFNISNGDGAVADASIAINGITLTSNNTGNATIELEDGTYNYTITASNYEEFTGEVVVNGTAITETILLTPLGVEENNQATVNIYPNPTKGNITIESNSKISKLSLFTFDGKLVSLYYNQVNTLDIKHLEYGIYLLQLQVGGSVITKRIIKN